ncbi:hypothetical protein AMAG_19862 [Allomyces macrogynus ATCC 38327]|uniref:Uncharacterized protein n=1 Tax=Allomyces macrogynus (strain ATCC 38327) TaxID=578462 RepID=A0A0L0T1N4_ALLM3|nr:hypothetical protein AMAG_19862 [Allomyces macrogynus ATCC 38327]|eukprot:KNE68753.1 hypothetical protein AMAG_19862 [Allomyces macrogynus ATCC 38327]
MVYWQARGMTTCAINPSSTHLTSDAKFAFPIELVDHILVDAAKLLAEPLPVLVLPTAETIAQLQQLLHVLPRQWAPRVGLAVLARLPHCSPVTASHAGRIDILERRREWGLPFAADVVDAVEEATFEGHLSVLKWWRTYAEFPNPVSWLVLDAAFACKTDDPDVLHWLLETGVAELNNNAFRYGLDSASWVGNIKVLQYCKEQTLVPMPKVHFANLDHISGKGFVNVLEWWAASGIGVSYTSRAMVLATENGHLDVLDWWDQQTVFPLKVPEDLDELLAQITNPAVLTWWSERRL